MLSVCVLRCVCAAGVESMIAPVLLSEIAASDTRGAITSLHQLNVRTTWLVYGIQGDDECLASW